MDFHNPNEVIRLLEEKAVHTKNGAFVRVDDVRRLIEQRSDTNAIEEKTVKKFKTIEEARAAVKNDPEMKKLFDHPPREPGRAIPAGEPQPSSRT